METITLNYTEEIQKKIEITIPYFTKKLLSDGQPFVMAKVVDEKKCIYVSKCVYGEIGIKPVDLAFTGESLEATGEEFDEFFTKVSNEILNLVHV